MKQPLRKVEIVVISDVHLGTYGCHAKELLHYLESVKPGILVLNGDIIDIWQFKKRYWPKSHMKVVKRIMKLVSQKVKVYYVTGNHDEILRKFEGYKMGSFQVVNKLVLHLNNEKTAWIFHGDVFDTIMKNSRWLARLGAVGYDLLILMNRAANFISEKLLNKGKISFSKRIKNSVKSAVAFINDFEITAAAIAIDNKYDYVICGHIHQPCIRTIHSKNGKVEYMNSGDWVENLTALEYNNGEWEIVNCKVNVKDLKNQEKELSTKELFQKMVTEFAFMKAV